MLAAAQKNTLITIDNPRGACHRPCTQVKFIHPPLAKKCYITATRDMSQSV